MWSKGWGQDFTQGVGTFVPGGNAALALSCRVSSWQAAGNPKAIASILIQQWSQRSNQTGKVTEDTYEGYGNWHIRKPARRLQNSWTINSTQARRHANSVLKTRFLSLPSFLFPILCSSCLLSGHTKHQKGEYTKTNFWVIFGRFFTVLLFDLYHHLQTNAKVPSTNQN